MDTYNQDSKKLTNINRFLLLQMTPVRQPAVNRLSAPTAEAAVNLAIIIQQAATHSYSTWDRQDGAIRLPAGRIRRDKKAGFNPGKFFFAIIGWAKGK